MNNPRHRLLTELDQTGFGIKYETRLSAYTPPHWHQALELLLFEKGTVICKFEHSTLRAKPGDLYLINAHEVHETRCSRDAEYLCIHILPSRMSLYVPEFDQLSFSLSFASENPDKAAAYEQLRLHMQTLSRLIRENNRTFCCHFP